MAYKEIQQTPTWDFNETPVVEGEYLGKKDNVGENNSKIYNLRLADGNTVGVWGSTVLDGKMTNVAIGQKIKIMFLGSKPSPNRKGKNYKDFSVYVDTEC